MSGQILKPNGAVTTLQSTTGAATSFDQATLLHITCIDPTSNTSGATVTVVETQSGDVVGSVRVLAQQSVFLEKKPTHCVFASGGGCSGTSVGY